jgi:hypothetical protein
MATTKKAEEQRFAKDLEFTDGYVFNKEDRKYIVFLKSAGKSIVVDESRHKAMMNAYCGEDERTVEEIAATHAFPRLYFDEYKRIFGWTRDGMSLTDEDILDGDTEELAEHLIEKKRFEIAQKVQKKDWKRTKEDATKWIEFEAKQYNPFVEAINHWTPPALKIIKSPKEKKGEAKICAIGLSDLHYGASANARYMYSQPDWTTEKTCEAVDKFADTIGTDVLARTYNFSKAVIMGLGDLIHSLNGKTTRGTELKYDCIREDQFDYALSSLTHFISRILMMFPAVEVHSVYGNHNYETEMALFRALAAFFRNQPNIQFFNYSTRPASFRAGNTLILMDHGADSVERTYVPKPGKGLESHVQSLLLQKPELLDGVKTKLFVMGDRHHWENMEYGDFEYIMFSAPMAGDEHSSVNNLRSRARQSCLILDDSGLKEILHCYFD